MKYFTETAKLHYGKDITCELVGYTKVNLYKDGKLFIEWDENYINNVDNLHECCKVSDLETAWRKDFPDRKLRKVEPLSQEELDKIEKRNEEWIYQTCFMSATQT